MRNENTKHNNFGNNLSISFSLVWVVFQWVDSSNILYQLNQIRHHYRMVMNLNEKHAFQKKFSSDHVRELVWEYLASTRKLKNKPPTRFFRRTYSHLQENMRTQPSVLVVLWTLCNAEAAMRQSDLAAQRAASPAVHTQELATKYDLIGALLSEKSIRGSSASDNELPKIFSIPKGIELADEYVSESTKSVVGNLDSTKSEPPISGYRPHNLATTKTGQTHDNKPLKMKLDIYLRETKSAAFRRMLADDESDSNKKKKAKESEEQQDDGKSISDSTDQVGYKQETSPPVYPFTTHYNKTIIDVTGKGSTKGLLPPEPQQPGFWPQVVLTTFLSLTMIFCILSWIRTYRIRKRQQYELLQSAENRENTIKV